MVNYQEAIKRPFSDINKLLIGWLLSIIPIINLFATGYILESAKLTLQKKKNLPEWTNWGDLFIKGVMVLVISIIWAIPIIIIAFALMGTAIFAMMKSGVTKAMAPEQIIMNMIGTGAVPSLVTGVFILVILAVLLMYLLPLAFVHYIKQGDFSAAFDFKTIFNKAFTGKYFVAWIVAILICLVLSIIAGIIGRVPYLIYITNPGASFIGYVITLTLVAQAYQEIK